MLMVMPLSYMAFLFILSSIPDTGAATSLAQRFVAMIPPTVQDLLHIPAYGVLVLLWTSALRARGLAERWSLCAALPLASACGGMIEIYQAWVPGRIPSVVDFLCNAVGILLFVWLYQLFRSWNLARMMTRRFHT
jgi:VanZ family protein